MDSVTGPRKRLAISVGTKPELSLEYMRPLFFSCVSVFDRINVTTLSLSELQSQLRDINIKLGEARIAEKRALLHAVKEQAQALGITQDELLMAAGFMKAKPGRAPAKYYDPNCGKKWSGRGPKPKWLQDKNLDDYLVDRDRPEPQPWWPGE